MADAMRSPAASLLPIITSTFSLRLNTSPRYVYVRTTGKFSPASLHLFGVAESRLVLTPIAMTPHLRIPADRYPAAILSTDHLVARGERAIRHNQ